MNTPTAILLLEPAAADRELAELVLRREFGEVDLLSAPDAARLLDVLSGEAPEVCILSLTPGWAPARELLAIVRHQAPDTAIILFGTEDEILRERLAPGMTTTAVVHKDSAGFLALPAAIDAVLADRQDTTADGGVVLASLPVPAFFADADGRLSAINDALAAGLGVARGTHGDLRVAELCADDRSAAAWRTFLAGDSDAEVLNARLGGETQRLHLTRDASRAPQQRIFGVSVAVASTEVNVVNTRAPATPERGAGNDIALVFSHDLKEPIQQIRRLTRQLSEPGADMTRTVEQLDICAARAGGMLNSVLEYLLVTTRDEQPGLVDLNRCLEEALDNLHAEIDASGAHIVADQLPAIAGDAFQFVHLFQNLIGNALKFRGRAAPEVRITAGTSGSRWRLTISDNGIGVPEAHRERVFDIGKRLHTRDEYPGAGIGLTLCRRIVERHGGAIRFEPGDSAGACIVIELPRGPEKVHANA